MMVAITIGDSFSLISSKKNSDTHTHTHTHTHKHTALIVTPSWDVTVLSNLT